MIEDDLAIRINYHGGSVQQDRMIRDKLWSLKTGFKVSYHRATAVLSDGREFNCLLNPIKVNASIDYKEISIPFEDICLNKEQIGTTTEGIEEIGMQCGDIFTWKETKTDWLVCYQKIDEIAYFRSICCKCNVYVNFGPDFIQEGHIMGPTVHNIDWRQIPTAAWNNINYDGVLLLPKTKRVENFLKRFNKLTINGNQWMVQARNMMLEGIIEIAIKEDYNNATAYAQKEPPVKPVDYSSIYINGEDEVDCFEKYVYTIVGATDGVWSISDPKVAKIINTFNDSVTIGIISSKAGSFVLTYTYNTTETVTLDITIKSI